MPDPGPPEAGAPAEPPSPASAAAPSPVPASASVSFSSMPPVVDPPASAPREEEEAAPADDGGASCSFTGTDTTAQAAGPAVAATGDERPADEHSRLNIAARVAVGRELSWEDATSFDPHFDASQAAGGSEDGEAVQRQRSPLKWLNGLRKGSSGSTSPQRRGGLDPKYAWHRRTSLPPLPRPVSPDGAPPGPVRGSAHDRSGGLHMHATPAPPKPPRPL
eukprot:3773748-Prymnesium_polylepis.1